MTQAHRVGRLLARRACSRDLSSLPDHVSDYRATLLHTCDHPRTDTIRYLKNSETKDQNCAMMILP